MVVAHNITTNEGEGTAFVTVQLMNEIERNFVVKYATEEVPDEASGMHVFSVTIIK